MDIFIVGIAGSLGAICRYLVYLQEKSFLLNKFPYGTLCINLTGCLLIGVVVGLAENPLSQQRQMLSLFSIGFIGSFTTFSTFGLETLTLIQANQYIQAGLNIFLNVVLGIILIWIAKNATVQILLELK